MRVACSSPWIAEWASIERTTGGFGRINPDAHRINWILQPAFANDNIDLVEPVGGGFLRHRFPGVIAIDIPEIAGLDSLGQSVGFVELRSNHAGIDFDLTKGARVTKAVGDHAEDREYGDEKDAAGDHDFEQSECPG